MSDVKNIPRLRFPTFSDEWEKMRFSDFISYTKGFAFKSKDYQNDGVRIVRVSDLGYDSIKSSHGIYLDKSKVHSVEKYVIDEGDIIVTTVGSRPELIDSSVGRGILVRKNGEGLLNQNLVKINKCEKIKNKFLFGFFNTKKYFNYITQIQRGNANQSNITLKEFFNYQVSIPSLPEQQKIADFLTAVDKRIELLEKKKTLLETYMKGVMKKIFNQEIRFKDDNGNEFPDWEEKKVIEICEVKVGGTPSTSKPEYWDGDIPWINSGEIKDGIIIEPSRYITELGLKRTSTYMLPKGTSVLAMTGATLGKMGILSFSSTANQSVAGFVTDPITSKFIFYNFIHDQRQILSKAGGAAQKGVNKNTIENFDIRIPCPEEQVKICEFLSSIDNQIELLDTQIDKSKTWKKGLLQKMFV